MAWLLSMRFGDRLSPYALQVVVAILLGLAIGVVATAVLAVVAFL